MVRQRLVTSGLIGRRFNEGGRGSDRGGEGYDQYPGGRGVDRDCRVEVEVISRGLTDRRSDRGG